MYGTIARFRVRPGAEDRLAQLSRAYEEIEVPGYVAQYLYQLDNDAREYYLAVVFDSKEAYVANANSPEQDARYQQMLDLLEGPPEWHDGTIIFAQHSQDS